MADIHNEGIRGVPLETLLNAVPSKSIKDEGMKGSVKVFVRAQELASGAKALGAFLANSAKTPIVSAFYTMRGPVPLGERLRDVLTTKKPDQNVPEQPINGAAKIVADGVKEGVSQTKGPSTNPTTTTQMPPIVSQNYGVARNQFGACMQKYMGKNGVHADAMFKDPQILALLKAHPGLIKEPLNQSYTLFHLASMARDSAPVELLCRLAPDQINVKDRWGSTPLHYACQFGSDEAVKVLLAKGANTKAQASNGETVLHKALERNNPGVIVQLLDKDPELQTMKNQWGNTALHVAILQNQPSVVNVTALLSAGDGDHKDLFTIRNNRGETAMNIAESKMDLTKVMLLAKKGDTLAPRFIDFVATQMLRWTPPTFSGNTPQERFESAFEQLHQNSPYSECQSELIAGIMAKEIFKGIFGKPYDEISSGEKAKLQLAIHSDKTAQLPAEQRERLDKMGRFLAELSSNIKLIS